MMSRKDIWGLVKKFWVYLPLLGLPWGWYHAQDKLTETKATLSAERTQWKNASVLADQHKKEAEKRYDQSVKDATSSYVDWIEKQKPIIVQSTNTVREYAKTDAGKSVCLDADGVRRYEDQRALLDTNASQTP